MKLAAYALLLLATTAGASAQTFNVDLDGDGRPEQVTLKPYTLEKVRYGQLVVSRGGKPIWTGPRALSGDTAYGDTYVFGGDLDGGDISFVGDYDHDGKVDLVGTYGKSDVSPTRFRRFRWERGRFVFVKESMLLPADAAKTRFVWSALQPMAPLWVDKLSAGPAGQWNGTLMQSSDGKQTPVKLRWQSGAFVTK